MASFVFDVVEAVQDFVGLFYQMPEHPVGA